jgi:hypothetical protein
MVPLPGKKVAPASRRLSGLLEFHRRFRATDAGRMPALHSWRWLEFGTAAEVIE